MYDVFSITSDSKKFNLAPKNVRFVSLSKGMQNARLNHWNPFSYDVTKSRDGFMIIVGTFEKQFSKNYARIFPISQKITKGKNLNGITSSNRMMTS